jgi:hypothetical protein
LNPRPRTRDPRRPTRERSKHASSEQHQDHRLGRRAGARRSLIGGRGDQHPQGKPDRRSRLPGRERQREVRRRQRRQSVGGQIQDANALDGTKVRFIVDGTKVAAKTVNNLGTARIDVSGATVPTVLTGSKIIVRSATGQLVARGKFN